MYMSIQIYLPVMLYATELYLSTSQENLIETALSRVRQQKVRDITLATNIYAVRVRPLPSKHGVPLQKGVCLKADISLEWDLWVLVASPYRGLSLGTDSLTLPLCHRKHLMSLTCHLRLRLHYDILDV